MSAPVYLVPPKDVPLRLAVVSGMTGVPYSTLKEACTSGDIFGALKKDGKWHCTLEAYHAWVETGERGGNVVKAPFGQASDSGALGRKEGDRLGLVKGRSPSQPQTKVGRKRRGKRIPTVYEIGGILAANQEVSQPHNAQEL